jgi:hypothetical protein
VSAEEAINAADARADYLNRIYEILECDNPKGEGNRRTNSVSAQGAAPAGPVPAMVVPQYVAPTGYQPMGYTYQPMAYSQGQVYIQPMPTYVAPEGAQY